MCCTYFIHVRIINETSSDKTVQYFYIYYIVGVYLVTRNRNVWIFCSNVIWFNELTLRYVLPFIRSHTMVYRLYYSFHCICFVPRNLPWNTSVFYRLWMLCCCSGSALFLPVVVSPAAVMKIRYVWITVAFLISLTTYLSLIGSFATYDELFTNRYETRWDDIRQRGQSGKHNGKKQTPFCAHLPNFIYIKHFKYYLFH